MCGGVCVSVMHLSMLAPNSPPPGTGWGIFLVWSGRLAPGGRDIESLKCACAIRIVTIINFNFALKIIIIMVARAQSVSAIIIQCMPCTVLSSSNHKPYTSAALCHTIIIYNYI